MVFCGNGYGILILYRQLLMVRPMFRRVSSFIMFHSLISIVILIFLIANIVGVLSNADHGLRLASLDWWDRFVVVASVYFLPVIFVFPPTKAYPLAIEWAMVFGSVFATGLPITLLIRFRLIKGLLKRFARKAGQPRQTLQTAPAP